ncbi:MAG TPA: aspartate kinase [Elusimicrobiota bacterium]|nr:aspartate kinase [Elusimicrobiota bacterium]
MSLVVMKFGGSSVADADRIKNVANRVMARRHRGDKVVVVVSAPGDMTDDLIELAKGVTSDPDAREMDMLLATGEQVSIALLSMAIKNRGMDAVSLTGPQAGIYADWTHTKARITKIRPVAVQRELKKGRIVIVAGFQGLNPGRDIATLGRGGSDLTAVALAAALKADVCEIFTDVKGIYTADPRIVPEARKVDRISYDAMLELAGAGAQVMQARSIEVGKKYEVPIHVRSSFTDENGTMIMREDSSTMRSTKGKKMNDSIRNGGTEEAVVSGVALDRNQAKVTLADVPDRPGVAAEVFGALADGAINVDMIIQSAPREGVNDISFTVSRDDLKKALAILERVRAHLKARSVTSDSAVAKVSIVGVGMRSHPGVAASLFKSLASAGINIDMISTSEIKVACVVKENNAEKAMRIAHKTFTLEKK